MRLIKGVSHKRIPAFQREINDVSGAGDTVIAVASLMLAMHVPADQLAAVSNLAGGLVCEKSRCCPHQQGATHLRVGIESHTDPLSPKRMNFQEFRERVNVVLYSSKGQVLSLLKILNLLVSASTLVVLAMYYGFSK